MKSEDKQRACDELGGLTMDIYDELVGDFKQQTEESFEEIKNNLKSPDWEILQRLAHSIKGSAKNLRIAEVGDSAEALESSAKELQDIGDYTKKFNALEKVYAQFKESYQPG